ncbi:hypothetical protein ACTQ45_07935 [Fundicoccus sp. Sow4_D5]|uniref:hypothetical protein n=1 Tax=Fundicoccus sp. Sow4_D5 TaxID=3438782 RepID=UPI003F8FF016
MNKRLRPLISQSVLVGLLVLGHTAPIVAAETEHYLDPLITEETIENDAIWAAYQDYKRGIEQFNLHDMASEEVTGTSLSEVEEFEAAVEPTFHHLSETESYLSYMYESETTNNPNDDQPVLGELLFYFIDEELYYTGIGSLDLVINNDQLLPMGLDQEWLDTKNSYHLMVEFGPRVFGLSQMVYQGEDYYQVLLPQGETTEQMYAQFIYIYQDHAIFGYQIELEEILDSPQGAMKDLFVELTGLLNE